MKGIMAVKELNESGLYVSEMDWDERYKSKSNLKGNFIRIIEPISNGDSGVIYYLKTDDGYLVEGECYIIEDSPKNVNRTVSEWITEYQKKNIQLCGKGFNGLFGKAGYTYFRSRNRNENPDPVI